MNNKSLVLRRWDPSFCSLLFIGHSAASVTSKDRLGLRAITASVRRACYLVS